VANKTVLGEAQQVKIATELIQMGARLQVLQEETTLSRERLLKLYKEVKGESPSKGMLPYSTDWFISWQPNSILHCLWAYTSSCSRMRVLMACRR
jgi:flagellar transcriptional activator FlhC